MYLWLKQQMIFDKREPPMCLQIESVVDFLMSVLRHPLGHLWTVRHLLVPEEHIRDQLNNKYSTYGLVTYCFHGTIGYDRWYETSYFIPNTLFIWIFCIKNIICMIFLQLIECQTFKHLSMYMCNFNFKTTSFSVCPK